MGRFFQPAAHRPLHQCQPPAPPTARYTPCNATIWNYRNDYLLGLAPAQAANTPLPSADTLTRYRAQPSAASATRSGALGALVYLRSLPLLRGVARAVPAHWQRRVKNWLQA